MLFRSPALSPHEDNTHGSRELRTHLWAQKRGKSKALLTADRPPLPAGHTFPFLDRAAPEPAPCLEFLLNVTGGSFHLPAASSRQDPRQQSGRRDEQRPAPVPQAGRPGLCSSSTGQLCFLLLALITGSGLTHGGCFRAGCFLGPDSGKGVNRPTGNLLLRSLG